MKRYQLAGAEIPVVFSTNYSMRPRGVEPELIVLHSTCGAYEGALRWLCSPRSLVSAHFLVARDGQRAAQIVPTERAAWHAGVSCYDHREHVNNWSVGIEMEHMDGEDDWPEEQLRAVADICAQLIAVYGIAPDAIVSHAEVAVPAGRKVDPVDFPWEQFTEYLNEARQTKGE